MRRETSRLVKSANAVESSATPAAIITMPNTFIHADCVAKE